MNSFDEKLKDKGWLLHPDYHIGWLVVSPIAIAIAFVVFLLCFTIIKDYTTAPYQEEVTATLVDIREGEVEDWEYVNPKEKDPRYRETRVTYKKVYGLYWEYYINDEKLIWEESEVYGTSHKVGDTKTMRFWSRDGEEYHHTDFGTEVYVILSLCVFVMLLALYIILRVLIVKIRVKKRKKKKGKRR